MKASLSTAFVILVLGLSSSVLTPLWAQQQPGPQPTFLTPVEMKDQFLRGSINVAQHDNDGVIGMAGKGTATGYHVETVVPGGPAANAGILPGELIVSMDGTSLVGLDATEALKPIAGKQQGETVNFTVNRNGETKTVAVTVDVRKRLFAKERENEIKLPPAVGQAIFGGDATITASLSETEQYPTDAFLLVYISSSKDAAPFVADDLKFFVLDGTGQQLRHLSLDEIKYGIQLSVAQNWKGENYPPPPPPSPQRQYTISGVENGNYTITNMGGTGSISGTSSSTYTVTQQPDYNQLGYSLGLAIRKYRDEKSDKKLIEQANQAIASWEGPYFKSQSPVVPGENRNGEIMYWTGSSRRPQPPYRVVIFLTNPKTQKEEHVTFAFGVGAEKIKEEFANQSVATPAQADADVLHNGDVVTMVKAGIGAEIIIAKIKTSSCSFDTSPAALKGLKDADVPENVILAMVEAPKN